MPARPHRIARRCRPVAVGLVALAAVALAGCAAHRAPTLAALDGRHGRDPVVIVPGITGSKLEDVRDGRLLWGDARQIFVPRDGARALIRPIDVPLDRASGGSEGDGIASVSAVTEVKLFGLIRVDVYGALVRMLEGHGYRAGDIEAPDGDSDLYLFHYDWRQSNVLAAARLAERLEAIRVARGSPRLRVNLICQSNAGTIVRYLIKYGGVPLERAERGEGATPERIDFDKVILVGNAHGGALAVLNDLHRGRRYVRGIGRRMLPETIFSFPSVIETLPSRPERPFVDERGETIDASLFDVGTWRRRGLSVFAETARRRLARPDAPPGLGDEEARIAYLDRALDRSRRLHALLARDVPRFPDVRYYSIQNGYRATAERAVLGRDGRGTWLGLPEDRRVRHDAALLARVAAPGDGHATVESQGAMSPQEQAALARATVWVPAPHRKIIHHPAAHRWILEFIADGARASLDR